MPPTRIFLLTSLAMIAFAGNSLLCRLALKNTDIDAASFTSIRLFSGALVLFLLVWLKNRRTPAPENLQGNWLSGLALFSYAAGFSFAYDSLTAATGALLLFSAVQATMIGHGLWSGERFFARQIIGLLFAFAGLLLLLLPGISAPPIFSSLLMLSAGVAWGIYSLRGKNTQNAIAASAGNFLRSLPFTLVLSVLLLSRMSLDSSGVAYALGSGALASGLGYVIWYVVLPELKSTTAATVQLSVPAIAAIGGILLLGEALNLRLAIAAMAILGGIAMVILWKTRASQTDQNARSS